MGLDILGLKKVITTILNGGIAKRDLWDLIEDVDRERLDCEKDTFLDIEFIDIPEGEFVLGKVGGVEGVTGCKQNCEIVHLHAYQISKYPITVGQFKKFLKVNPDLEIEINFKDKDHKPVKNVSYLDCLKFIEWANIHCLDIPKGYEMALPDELQWEKAAKGPLGRLPDRKDNPNPTRRYPWGNRWSDIRDGLGGPRNVSPYGVRQMMGGVWEWCSNKFEEKIIPSSFSSVKKKV